MSNLRLYRRVFGWLLGLLAMHVTPSELVWCHGADGSRTLKRAYLGECVDPATLAGSAAKAGALASAVTEGSRGSDPAKDCTDVQADVVAGVAQRMDSSPERRWQECPAAEPVRIALCRAPVLTTAHTRLQPLWYAVPQSDAVFSTVLRI